MARSLEDHIQLVKAYENNDSNLAGAILRANHMAALAGLDMQMPGGEFFGKPLEDAVESGKVPMSRLDDMVHRMLRSMFAAGVIDHPSMPRMVVDPFKGRDDAQHIAEESIVLLRNQGNLLPLDGGAVHRIAYERLLLDLIEGDQTLFVRRDEVEAQWEWIDAIRSGWAESGLEPKSYGAGNWGPSAAIALAERDGVTWHE